MSLELANIRTIFALLFCSINLAWAAEPGLAGAVARVRIRARIPGLDEPVAVRAIIRQSNGEILPGEWGDSVWPPVSIRGKAVTPEMLLELPPGETSFTLGKGPEYLPQTIVVTLESGRTHLLEALLEPVLDLRRRGWRAGDAHVHFFHGDGQVVRSPEEAYAICAAAGLNFCSFAGEHFGAPNLTREEAQRVWRPYQTGECRLWLGAEAPKNAWGHHASILYDPWRVGDALPYQNGIHSVHRQGGVCFPVHPDRHFPFRSFDDEPSLFPLHNFHKFYPIAALSGHLLDAWSGISDEPAGDQKLAPYFELLALGHKIPLLSDSDFCMDRLNNGLKGAGFWMNYLQLDGAEATRASVCTAIRKGRAMCTTGPLVLFEIGGALSGDILPADGTERALRIRASHRFNPWTLSRRTFADTADCQIEAIELIRNGSVVRTWRPASPDFEILERLSEQEDSWYMVRVLGNEGVWTAGYASPIYFASSSNSPRRPPAFKMLVNGRLYDAHWSRSHRDCLIRALWPRGLDDPHRRPRPFSRHGPDRLGIARPRRRRPRASARPARPPASLCVLSLPA